jgi:AAA+ ATPase superfamily predicted ATPase
MMAAIFSGDSLFLDEGRAILIDEFGKDYGNYFSILTLIASSKTSRPGIESILQIETGGFLDRLEHDFGLIEQIRPLFAKPQSRNVKYRIRDNFLNFWFRYVYKYRSAIEMRNYAYIKNIVKNDWTTFSGFMLEKYFREKYAAAGLYSAIGAWWEKGNQNEIDLVAVNEVERKMLVAEVKRQKKKIDLSELQKKAAAVLKSRAGYSVSYQALSLEDM